MWLEPSGPNVRLNPGKAFTETFKIPAGRYRDLLVFWPLKTSLLSKSSRYLPVWSDCLSLYSLLALQVLGVSFFESARSLNNAILN